jgi:uncharacterized protein YggU (UPF0235/DUF167 family)
VAAASPFRPAHAGVAVAVRLTPKAARDAVEAPRPAADGSLRLVVKVTAAPERGKANQALLRLLARTWHLPASRLALVAGASDRNKTVRLAGAPEALMAKLEAWLAAVAP